MNNDIPNFNLLAIFAAVIEHGSLSKAAEQLNTNQSTVSTAMARLSKHLGQELYQRKGRGIEPTSYALDLFRQLKAPVNQLNTIFQSLGQFEPNSTIRRFVLTAPEHLQWILLDRFEKQTPPGLTLEVYDHHSDEEEMYADLLSHKYDLLIDVLPSKQSSMENKRLLENRFVVVCSQSHPRIQGHLTEQQFMTEKHALLERKRGSSYSLTHYTDVDLSQRTAAYRGRTLFSNLMLCSQTDYLSVVPLSLALQFEKTLQLQIFTPPFEHSSMSTYLVWPKKFNHDPAHCWLRDKIESISTEVQTYVNQH